MSVRTLTLTLALLLACGASTGTAAFSAARKRKKARAPSGSPSPKALRPVVAPSAPHPGMVAAGRPTVAPSALRLHPDVAAAVAAGRPVVALESTIITHGMPYPDNLRTAREVEQVIRDAGALPATVAVLDGVCLVGLTPAELERLAQLGPEQVAKCSRRDLAAVMARRGHGATTVSATMLLAHRAGIAIFVTGGVGGVHRGGEVSMDVSADLVELGRTPVCVVSAGVKSILDIPRTLEVTTPQAAPESRQKEGNPITPRPSTKTHRLPQTKRAGCRATDNRTNLGYILWSSGHPVPGVSALGSACVALVLCHETRNESPSTRNARCSRRRASLWRHSARTSFPHFSRAARAAQRRCGWRTRRRRRRWCTRAPRWGWAQESCSACPSQPRRRQRRARCRYLKRGKSKDQTAGARAIDVDSVAE